MTATDVQPGTRTRTTFHTLAVARVDRLTEDSVAVTFDVPEELRAAYAFDAGQSLTLASTRRAVRCPRCGSAETELTSEFGSTACKAQYRCTACREPFDHVKEI